MTDPGQGTKADTSRWPVEIRLKKAEKVLEIDFDDGRSFSFPVSVGPVRRTGARPSDISPTVFQATSMPEEPA